MTTQREKAIRFAELHVAGEPLILFNIWDAGSAISVAEAGAKAIGTGSWSVAAANGFSDGEELPLEFALANIMRIVESVDLPVTLDFEGGYAVDVAGLRRNVSAGIDAGAVGINFEDQIVRGEGLYSAEEQSDRIRTMREVANERSIPLFINARTDVFLKADPSEHSLHMEEAKNRARAYAQAGASGFFAPGLKDPQMIGDLCSHSPIPVNIMIMSDTPPNAEMASLGVARISYGPGPYRQMIDSLKRAASKAFAAES